MSAYQKMISGAELVSGTRSTMKVQIRPEDHARIAIFSNGVFMTAPGFHESREFRTYRNAAIQAGIHFEPGRHVINVPVDDMKAIYSEAGLPMTSGGAGTGDEIAGVEKQAMARKMFADAAARGYSDIHIYVRTDGAIFKGRKNGKLQVINTVVRDEAQRLINAIFSVADGRGRGMEGANTNREGVLSPQGKGAGLIPPGVNGIRLNYTDESNGNGSLMARLLYASRNDEVDITDLGYHPTQVRSFDIMRRSMKGLYVLSGKVSSGKTTTLERTMRKMSVENDGEISFFTIEDPRELNIFNATQFFARPQRDNQGMEIDGWTAGLKSVLRSDVNVVVLGEIRTREVAEAALDLVTTGHPMWTTTHADSALGILTRWRAMGADMTLAGKASITRGLIYQRLVGVLCPDCKMDLRQAQDSGRITEGLAQKTCDLTGVRADSIYVRRKPSKTGPRCPTCGSGEGLVGRTVVAEVILPDQKLMNLYLKDDDEEAALEYWLGDEKNGCMGGMSVGHHALMKVGAGIIDPNEVELEVQQLMDYEKMPKDMISRLPDDVRSEKERVA